MQYSLLVLDCIAGCKAKLYCKARLYCNRRGLEAGSSVLQYTALYCNLGARQGWTVLRYSAQPSHDTTTVAATRHAGAGRWACWALGMLALGGQAGRSGQAAGRAGRALGAGGKAWARRAQAGARVGIGAVGGWAQQARGRQALGARGACCLGARAGYGLCTWCTRPVFCPVRLSIFPESIFGHCS